MARHRICGSIEGWRHVDVEHIDGDNWYLNQDAEDPLRFVDATHMRCLTPPHRFVHDFGSIPQIAQLVMGGKAGEPEHAQFAGRVYPLHDWAYEHQAWDNGDPMSRRDADDMLLMALEQVGCSEWYCTMVWLAVRIGGAGHWNAHHRKGHVCGQYGNG